MVETIFTSNLVVETILPFLLIFTIVFAILEKSKILGDGKRQIDAIVALAIGLLFIAFGSATDIVVRMIPILGIALVVILIFMILFGSLYNGKEEFKLHKYLKLAIAILIGIVVAITVLILTGGLDYVTAFLYGDNTGLLINGFFIIVVVVAIIAVVVGGKEKKDDKKS